MPTKEEMILRILQERPDLTREVIEKNINKKKKATDNFLTDEGAAYMFANDLGIDLSSEGVLSTKITIKDLIVGAYDVTITGKVLAVYPVRTFRRSNGSEGKVARIVISDETGIVNVVLWDERTEIVESKVSKSDVIRVNHGYVKTGLNGKPEINVGYKGSVITLSPSFSSNVAFKIKEVYNKIREIKIERAYINLIGVLEKVSVTSFFRRKDGGKGKVVRARVADETGRVVAVFWEEKTDLIQEACKGDCIKIVNGKIRKGLAGTLEIHIVKESELSILQEKPKGIGPLPSSITNIGCLTSELDDVDIIARVTSIGKIREFIRSSGEKVKVGEIFLADKTGSVKLLLWDKQTERIKDVSAGDVVLVEGSYTREDFSGDVNLNLGKRGILTLNPDVEDMGDRLIAS